MKRILRGELFRLSRSPILWLMLVVMLAADLFLNSRCEVNGTNLYELPRLCTMSQFTSYAENASMSVRSAVQFFRSRGQLEESSAEDLIGVFQDVHPFQFRWVLSQTQGMLVIPLVFAMLFLARDIDNRSYRNALYIGLSRGRVFAGKTVFLLFTAFLLSLAGILLLTVVYAGSVLSRLPAAYVWSRLLLHALADTALIAPALLVTAVLRKLTLSGVVCVLYGVLLRFAGGILPMLQAMNDMERWAQGGNLLPVLLWSVGTITVCVVLSWLRTAKVRLN